MLSTRFLLSAKQSSVCFVLGMCFLLCADHLLPATCRATICLLCAELQKGDHLSAPQGRARITSLGAQQVKQLCLLKSGHGYFSLLESFALELLKSSATKLGCCTQAGKHASLPGAQWHASWPCKHASSPGARSHASWPSHLQTPARLPGWGG